MKGQEFGPLHTRCGLTFLAKDGAAYVLAFLEIVLTMSGVPTMQNLLDKLKSGDGAMSAMLWIGLGLLILIVVIVIAMWLIRALRPTLNMSGGVSRGGRVQRLAITDAFPLDREGRKLVIVRRDNVEHLLLIGGPNDVLVESSIVRSERASRGRNEGEGVEQPKPATPAPAPVVPAAPVAQPIPQQPVRPAAPNAPIGPLPRPVSPPAVPQAAPRAAPVTEDEFERALKAMEAPRPGSDSSRPAVPSPVPPSPAAMPVAPPAMRAPTPAPQPPTAMPSPSEPRMQERQEFPRPDARRPDVVERPPLPQRQQLPPNQDLPQRQDIPQREPASQREPMSEMARRLSEVLQKPISPPQQRASVAPPPPAPRPAPKPAAAEAEMDLLEEEMAKLLGRPGTPPKT
ncbi:hypothetical protein MCEMSEM23_02233 [Rhabdaerophilaceae bacterium]